MHGMAKPVHNLVNSGQFEECSFSQFRAISHNAPPPPPQKKKKSGKVLCGDTAHIKYPGNNYLLLYLTRFL